MTSILSSTRKSRNSKSSMKRRSKKKNNSSRRIISHKNSMKDIQKESQSLSGLLMRTAFPKIKKLKLNHSNLSSTLKTSGALTLMKSIQGEDPDTCKERMVTERNGKWKERKSGNLEEETTEERNGMALKRNSGVRDPDTARRKE
jgi:hypothetical protein